MADSAVKTVEDQATPWYKDPIFQVGAGSGTTGAIGGALGSIYGKNILSKLGLLFKGGMASAAGLTSIPLALSAAAYEYGQYKGKQLDEDKATKQQIKDLNQLLKSGFVPASDTDDGLYVDSDGDVVPEKYARLAMQANGAASNPKVVQSAPVQQVAESAPVVTTGTTTEVPQASSTYEKYLNELEQLKALRPF